MWLSFMNYGSWMESTYLDIQHRFYMQLSFSSCDIIIRYIQRCGKLRSLSNRSLHSFWRNIRRGTVQSNIWVRTRWKKSDRCHFYMLLEKRTFDTSTRYTRRTQVVYQRNRGNQMTFRCYESIGSMLNCCGSFWIDQCWLFHRWRMDHSWFRNICCRTTQSNSFYAVGEGIKTKMLSPWVIITVRDTVSELCDGRKPFEHFYTRFRKKCCGRWTIPKCHCHIWRALKAEQFMFLLLS